jgi:hypothetical protein
MTTQLVSLTFDANDPLRLARFWASALGWELLDETHDTIGVLPTDGTRFILAFVPVAEARSAKSRLHLDLVSESPEHQAEMVAELVALGAQPVNIGQAEDEDHVVLADPEGNELCVVIRGDFLADTGLLGAIVFEPGNPETGRFWGQAIGWPLVYDQGGDTAIRAPDGTGPFLTFGPPTGDAKATKNRLHLDVAPTPGGDQRTEVERLLRLGATHVDIGQRDVPWVVLADPDGNELCVLPAP